MAEERRIGKYENARMVGARALQIAMGAPFLVKLTTEDLERIKYNPIEIAKLELKEGVMPIDVVQVVEKGLVEDNSTVEKQTE